MLYYSHVNEDNRIEKDLLSTSGCTTAVVVAGSGERVIALLNDNHCKEFHVVDVNEEALFLLQLKLTALDNFSIEDYYQFIGHHHADKKNRIDWFNAIKNKMSEPCRMYWEKNISSVEKGIFNTGHFEKFLSRVRPSVNLFLGKNFQNLLTGMPVHSKKFPGLRWKLLKKLYSFRWIYSVWGNRDIAFTSKDASTNHIPDALNKVIYKNESASCFMMHLIFKGNLRNMKEEDLPPSLQKNILQSIKRKLENGSLKIYYHHTDLLSFIRNEKAKLQQPIFYSVSDVLSFENNGYMQQLLDTAKGIQNMVVWRTFLRNRVNGSGEISTRDSFTDLSEKESTRMYQVFSVKY